MLRGETFFAAALRKIADETGMSDYSKLEAVSVVKTWNTLFPDSNWDANRQPGYKGTQTVNIVVLCRLDARDIEASADSREAWAVSNHRWVAVDEALKEGGFDKYVRLNVLEARGLGLL